jgi:hypothetical protein
MSFWEDAAGFAANPIVGIGTLGKSASAVGSGIGSATSGGGKKGQAPPMPDYKGAAEATAAGSQASINAQTGANRPNQNTPFGFSNWSQDPATGKWSQSTGFNGPLAGAAEGLEGQIANQGPLDTGTQARDQAIKSAYGQATSRLDPQWGQRDEGLEAQLAAKGLAPGSEAYQRSRADFSRDRNDAYTSAMASAVGQGTAAQQATFGENLAAQNNPYQQLGALHGLSQTPGFTGAGAYQPANYLGAAGLAGNYGLQSTQMNNQMWADLLSGGGQAAAGAAALSDERVKDDVHRLPVDAEPGVPFAMFKYKGDPQKRQHVGVIAQDLERRNPGAVKTGRDGLKRVAPKYAPFSFASAA